MNVILFGATRTIGQGVLRECLLDTGVDSVLAVGRGDGAGETEPAHDVHLRHRTRHRFRRRAAAARLSLC
ncbi:hypothetical protein [uncultured Bradyrhizobium sp.]|uniref:hypothetical protein n=1 Tax=uncultured Bradyrhizobium sp. TaxID=199684 RepID=UPI0035CBE41E